MPSSEAGGGSGLCATDRAPVSTTFSEGDIEPPRETHELLARTCEVNARPYVGFCAISTLWVFLHLLPPPVVQPNKVRSGSPSRTTLRAPQAPLASRLGAKARGVGVVAKGSALDLASSRAREGHARLASARAVFNKIYFGTFSTKVGE